ncbi:MAG TPA: energy transducer TonB [Chthoniobacterales bacterium]|jgi:TonB family protein
MQTKSSKFAGRSALCAAFVAMLIAAPLTTANAGWIQKPNPKLPYGLFIDGVQGSVVLSLVLDRAGRVTDTRVLRSSGLPALDKLAEDAAMNWRLSPDSIVASDLTQGRVELLRFHNPPPRAETLLPGAQTFWATAR